MNFSVNSLKIKSSWFDKDSKIKKIGFDAFITYIHLYRFFIPNQDQVTFAVSLKMLKKETGFPNDDTLKALKQLVRYKIISVSERWDRIKEDSLFFVYAIDVPATHREQKGKTEVDVPDTKEDYYIPVDLQLMQHYIDLGFDGREIALFCLFRKWSNLTERKCWLKMDTINKILGLSNEKIQTMIRNLNRKYLLLSVKKLAGYMNSNGRKKRKYKYDHYICFKKSDMKHFTVGWIKEGIEKNIKQWDDQAKGKKIKESVVIEDEIEVDQDDNDYPENYQENAWEIDDDEFAYGKVS